MALTEQQQTDLYKMAVGMFDAAPGTFYMDWLAGLIENEGFTIDMIYESLAIDPSWQALNFGFTDAATNEQFATAFVDQITGDTLSDENRDFAIDLVETLVNSGLTRAQAMHAAIDALDAVPHDDENFGAAAARFDNKVEVARDYTENLSGNALLISELQATLASVDETEESVEAAKAANAGAVNPPPTFTLTSDIDTLLGTTGNDIFKGTINGDDSTAQAGDFVDGSTGTDKLELTVVDDEGDAVLELVNLEQVFIRDLDGADIDASLWAGVKEIWSNKSTEFLDVFDVQEAVTIGVADNDEGIEIDYADDALGSDEATQAFKLKDAKDGAYLGAFTGGDDVITTLSFAVEGKNDVFYDDNNEVVETLIVTGAGSLEIGSWNAELEGVETADFSGNSGGVTFEVFHEDIVVTGGSGDDEITLSNGDALTEDASISLGAGDDSLLRGASVGIGAAVLDGGEGTDTVASTLLEVGNQANIKSWEVLDVAGEDRSIDASLFKESTFESLAKTGALAGDVIVTKLAGTNIVVDDTSASNDTFSLTATLATATGTSDSAEINFNGDGDSTMAKFVTAGLESITIDSQSENDDDVNAITLIQTLDNVLTKISITGDKDFTLGGVMTNSPIPLPGVVAAEVASLLTSIDGSAATGDLNITAGAPHAANTTAPVVNTTYNSLSIKTGTGDDIVNIGGRGTVSTDAGEDEVTVNALGVSVDVGADEDVDLVTLAAAANYNGDFLPTTRITTISNLAEDDQINFTALSVADVNDFTTDALTKASLDEAVNFALADGTSAVDSFQWVDDNTYIVIDGGVDNDSVIKLIGTLDLESAAGVVTIG